MIEQDALEVPRREGEAAGRLIGDDLGIARHLVEDREFAEEVARAEPRDGLPALDDLHAPLDDDEEPGADLAVAHDHGAGPVLDLLGLLRDRRQPVGPDPREERARGKEVRAPILGECHGPSELVRCPAVMLPARAGAVNPPGGGSGDRAGGPDRVDARAILAARPLDRAEEDPAAMATRDEIVESIAGMTLFADLSAPQLQGVAGRMEEAFFADGERILRQGLTGSGFFVVLDGEVGVVIDGEQRNRLGRGEFFGEMSILLQAPPVADIVALRPVRCLVLPGPALEQFLIDHPRVMFRMLQAVGRRLTGANRARS